MSKFQIPRSLFERILAAGREQVYDLGSGLIEESDIKEGLESNSIDTDALGIELVDDRAPNSAI